MFRGLESRGLFNRRIWGCQGREGSNLALTMLTWFHGFSTIPRPGATDPPSQTPRLGSFLANEIFENSIVPQVDFRHCVVDFQCFGKGLWTKTMANHVKPENLQGDLWHQHKAMSTTKNLKPTSRIKAKVNFCQNKILLVTCVGFCLWLYKSQNTLPCPTFIWLPSMSESLGKIQWPNTWAPVQNHYCLTSLEHHWYTTSFHISLPFQNLEPQTRVPSTRPWLLHCQLHCCTSRFSSEPCSLSMLRQGPVDKNGGQPCQICDTLKKPCPPPKILSQDHESKSRWISAKTRLCFAEHPSPVHFYLVSIPFQWLFSKDPLAQHLNTCPTPLMSQKSRTALVHHFIPYFSTIPKPGATNPRPKHQALAPSLPTALLYKSILVRALFTFNASARACGQKRWPTMSNLRHTQKAMSTTKNLKPRSRVEVKVNFCQNKTLLCRTPFPGPLLSCFHPISMTLFERSTGPTPEHLSNTTNVSEVSNSTGTPLDSIFLYHSETWSHNPASQAPGLGSFRANVIVSQVNVLQSLVDFECFGKGLWTKTVANHAKAENLQRCLL